MKDRNMRRFLFSWTIKPHRIKNWRLIESLRKKWTPYPGAKIEVKNFEQGPPVVAPVEVRVFGDNLDTLRSLAARVENMLQNTDGTIYIDNPVDLLKSDIKVDINKEKAQLLGIQTVNIDRTVRLAVAGLNMGSIRMKMIRIIRSCSHAPKKKYPRWMFSIISM